MSQLTTLLIVGRDKGLELEVTEPEYKLGKAEAKEQEEQEGAYGLNSRGR